MKKQLILAVVMVMVVLFGSALAIHTTRQAQAQDAASDMRALLERLRGRMAADPNFTVSVTFVNALVAGERSWTIPLTDPNTGGSRTLGEVGTDYLCFTELGVDFNNSVCTPFTNVMMLLFNN